MHAFGKVLLLVAFLIFPAVAGAEEPAGGTAELVELPLPKDSISPAQVARIEAAIAAYQKRKPALAQAETDDTPYLYPFFPQAGFLGKDLFLTNFTDQDSRPGLIRDWDCSDYTYDGHQGHDSVIRTFREQAIGVPVFAVRDGVVVDAHDGEPDLNTEWRNVAANYVIIDHGGGYIAWYFHFKRGSVAVATGQHVTAGTQLGLTGSSGISNWPHLHFETRKNGAWFEPSAGPCRSGDSLWASQPPVERGFYVADFLLTPGRLSIPDRDTFLFDEAARTGTFAKGMQTFSVRMDLRNLPTRSTYRVSVLNPRGKVAAEISDGFGNSGPFFLAYGLFGFDVNLDTPGKWRVRAEINGGVAVDAPFTVVNTARQVKNRPPKKVTARLSPKSPVEGQVMACEIQTSLMSEDPDYDIVSYRYEWKVNGRVVRSVTSAALMDLLPAGVARAKDKVSCKVVPSDGKRSGPASVAGRSVEEP
ncbi:MAG TPA: M23 family metallopeptidase [Thermoanaerobaculia bacterium]|nr:M23 family metallopeptidase [Thermoanaerobaculia bacterium]